MGWSETADGAIISTSATYEHTITSTSTSSGSPTNTTLYARFQSHPTAIVANPTSLTIHLGSNGKFTYSLTPSGAYDEVTATSGNTSVATVSKSGNTFTVTAVSAGSTNITLSASRPGSTPLITTVAVTVPEQCAVPTITVTPTVAGSTANVTLSTTTSDATIYYTTDGTDPSSSSTAYDGNAFVISNGVTVKAIAVKDGYSDSEIASVTYTADKIATPTISVAASGVSFDCAVSGVSYHYTTDGTTPTESSTLWDGTPVTGLADGAAITVIAMKSGMIPSDAATARYYPTSNANGSEVVINDTEDHNWSYYSDPDCPIRSLSPADVKITYYGDGIVMTGNADYTASSSDFVKPGQTNYTGGAKVNVGGENEENTFIYYKTLERGANTQTAYTFSSGSQSAAESRCPYTTIPNPFQVRPTYGTPPTSNRASWTGWRGFQCWRLKNVDGGSVYSAASGGTALSTGAVINAETEIYFAPNSEYGMTVVLEAVWSIAYIVYATGNGNFSVPNHTSLGYERNFVVLSTNKDFYFGGGGNANNTANITDVNRPSTITPYLPNGTSGNGQIGRVKGVYAQSANDRHLTLQANTKFENVQLNFDNNNNILTADGHDLIVGRGCTGTVGTVRGLSGNTTGAIEYTIRLESGTFGTFNMIDGTTHTHSGTVSAITIFGSDYDRAKEDNSKLSIAANSTVYGGSSYQQFTSNTNRNNLTYDWLIKSGTVQSEKDVAAGTAATCIYMGNSGNGNDSDGNRYQGKRRLVMEGGEVCSIAGGLNNYGNNYATYIVNDGWAVQIRIKGGNVRGSVFGAAEFAGASGDRQFIFTGGTINGWVAGGCNGTHNDGGELYGSTSLYVGGTTQVGTQSGGTHVGGNVSYTDNGTKYGINGADGGNVFGAGCGINPTNRNYVPNGNYTTGTVGRVNNSTVIVADGAHVWREVYGGGNYGWVRDNGTSSIYILGGTIGGVNGYGNVFGGSNNQQGQDVAITVKGGDVKGGVYGGSHSYGTINDNVTMSISGGLIEQGAFGGGYGTNNNSCDVTGAVDITMTGGTVLTGLYGGGNVNSKVSDVTTVSVNGGTIGASDNPANVHGGGLGSLTRIRNSVVVNIGAQNATSGATIYGDVYGGSAEGKTNGNTARENNATTTVTLNAGTIYGSLYGGGLGTQANAADVYGPVQVSVYGGSVKTTAVNGSGAVYGCNNVNGSPRSTVDVDIYGTDPAPSEHSFALDAVYGGGNRSDYAGKPVVEVHNCDNSIGYVYGGGNASDVTGTDVTIYGGNTIGTVFGGGNGAGEGNPGANITSGGTDVKIYGGTIGKVFGGSNAKGTITGTIKVTINKTTETGHDACRMDIGEVYGGGNMAASQAGSITIGCTGNEGEGIGDVYGGANAADITGNVTLSITGGSIDRVFGGNNTSGAISGTIMVNVEWDPSQNCGYNHLGSVFGGGNKAAYGSPSDNKGNYPVVNIKNGTVTNNVFGGGLGATAIVYGNPQVTIGDANASHKAVVEGDVYGGGDAAAVYGNTLVTYNDNNASSTVGKLFGGGNAAGVHGATEVDMTLGSVTTGIYGGCNTSGTVDSDITVNVTGGTVGSSTTKANGVFGGGYGSSTATSGNIDVNINGASVVIYGDVYGGSALGNVNGDTNDYTYVTLTAGTIHGDAYGGGLGDASNAALVNGRGRTYLRLQQRERLAKGSGTCGGKPDRACGRWFARQDRL